MDDLFDFVTDLLEEWNSPNKWVRWLARGCGCVVFVLILAFIAFIYYVVQLT
jgi:hypothetical protein